MLRRLAILSALYLVEGLPFGFQAVALPVYLRSHGVSLEAIGLVGALSLPWILKPLWAPLIDRYGSPRFGRRKSWIVPLQLALAMTCLLASQVPPERLSWLLSLVFLMNLFAATQDIAVDGWAVDLLSDEELGPGNAAQVVGYKVGMLTGGGLLVWAAQWIGWSGLFLSMAALIVVVAGCVTLMKEPPAKGQGESPPTISEVIRALRRSLSLPGGRWLLLFIGTYKLGESMIDTMFKPFLIDIHIAASDVGLWVGTWGMLFSILGSLWGGWLALRCSLWRALAWTACLRLIPLVGECALALVDVPSAGWIIAVTCAEHFFGGALTTAMFAYMMSRVDPRIGATHFTVFAAVEVLGKSPSTWAAGFLATWWGYAGLFVFGTVLSMLLLLLLIPLRSSIPGASRAVRIGDGAAP